MKNTEKFDLPDGVNIRHSEPSDHPRIIKAMKGWWDGRDLTSMLPRLFLEHFFNTSMVMEDRENELIAFLIGFLSQSQANEGYPIYIIGFSNYAKKTIGQSSGPVHPL